MFSEQKWRDSLKPGDKVLVSHGGWSGWYDSSVVVRVTKTQIVLKNQDRFLKNSGYLVGGGTWNRSYLTEPTPEIYAEEKERRLRIKCKNLLSVAKVPEKLEDVERMIAALESFVPKKEEAAG